MHKTITRSFALYPENSERLKSMAAALGCKPNRVVNLLIENARIQEIRRQEPVATLSVKNNRTDTQFSTTSANAVSA